MTATVVVNKVVANKRYAKRLDDIQPFRVVEVLSRAKALESIGHDIVHMQAGEPDFATAKPIVDAGIAALRNGATHYSDAKGLWELREAIAAYYQADYGVSVDPNRIMITPGASGALLLLAGLLIDAGDKLLMADPGYPCNRNFMRLVEGEGLLVPVTAADNFQLNADLVNQYWCDGDSTGKNSTGKNTTGSTVGALVASPANPTGTVINKQELAALFNAVDRRGGHLLVDEIYHGLDFPLTDDNIPGSEQLNTERVAPSILEITDQAFVINSFSKYFGMTGWRLGWLVAPEWACPKLEILAQNLFISMSTMAQYAALKCFEQETRDILDQRRDEFKRRCELLLPALRELGFIVPAPPAGGLYIYADVSPFLGRFGEDSQAFCLKMLEEHGLAITPGTDFGHYQCNNYVRFAFTTSSERLLVAIERMQKIFS